MATNRIGTGHVDKIVWQAGPAADPPDWEVLEGIVPPERIAGAARAFDAWAARNA